MRTFKTSLFCALILGVLSATQMGAFAHGHERPRPSSGPVTTKPNDQQSKEVSCYSEPGNPSCK